MCCPLPCFLNLQQPDELTSEVPKLEHRSALCGSRNPDKSETSRSWRRSSLSSKFRTHHNSSKRPKDFCLPLRPRRWGRRSEHARPFSTKLFEAPHPAAAPLAATRAACWPDFVGTFDHTPPSSLTQWILHAEGKTATVLTIPAILIYFSARVHTPCSKRSRNGGGGVLNRGTRTPARSKRRAPRPD